MCIAGQPAARYGTALLAVLLISVPAPAGAQGRQGNAPPINLSAPPAPPAAAAPAPPPRSATGRVLLAGSSGARGIWMPIFPFGGHLTPLDQVPFQPWARAIYDDRLAHQLEPHARCKASGGVRQIQTPYGIEIVELPEQQVLYIFDIGGPHAYRTVYMDGRTHPPDVTPGAYGHSIGWWDGDTLVVDTTGYNEAFWVDRRGLPGTNRLRTLERFTRAVHDTILYEITIDDPGAYTRPFTGRFELRLDPAIEVYEYVCQEANYAGGLMTEAREAGGAAPSTTP